MCGRFIQVSEPERIKANLFELEMDAAVLMEFRPRFNITPAQDIPTVINTAPPRLCITRWGLIPIWAKDKTKGMKMINARAETLLVKPSFKEPFRRRRCLVFSDGFYEWKGTGTSKTPFFIRLKSREPFAFAGLWDIWTDKKTGQDIYSSTIITTTANQVVSEIHDRMPLILMPDQYRTWLRPDAVSDSTLMGFLKPYASEEMEAYGVSRLVNNPRNDSAECIRPV